MRPTDPVELLVCAIATQENNPGTNPGNLRVAGQAHLVANMVFGEMAVFESRAWGTLALYRDILAKAALGMSIRSMIAVYCPRGDGANDPDTYVKHIAEWTGLDVDVPFADLIPPIVKLNQ
jgi:hypothetical protein